MIAGDFAPNGWSFCDGKILPISENDTLFQLIGTTYGGYWQETFALPDLPYRFPVHQGTGSSGTVFTIAENAGVETVTLSTQQIPAHNHALYAAVLDGTANNPQGDMLVQAPA